MQLTANITYKWTIEYAAPGITGWKRTNGGYVAGDGESEKDAYAKVTHLVAGDKRLDLHTAKFRNFRLN